VKESGLFSLFFSVANPVGNHRLRITSPPIHLSRLSSIKGLETNIKDALVRILSAHKAWFIPRTREQGLTRFDSKNKKNATGTVKVFKTDE